MRLDVSRDLGDSAYDFKRAVWPALAPMVGGGRMEPVEAVSHKGFNKELDALSGIDAWHLIDGLGIRGLASRVQWGAQSWDTFTIRLSRPSGAETEYQKRLRAIENRHRGFLLPEITVQAYLTDPKRSGELISLAVVNTVDLFNEVRRLYENTEQKRHCWGIRKTYSGEQLLWISWDYLEELGLRVGVVRRERLAA